MSRKKIKVLIFPGGTEIALEIHKALKDCKDIILYSTNSDISNHAPYVFKNNFVISDIKSKKWVNELNDIIIREKIDYVYPAYDDVIVALANNQKKIKTKIVIPPLKTCLITRSKKKTYDTFRYVLPTPEVYKNIKDIKQWPVFLKPDKGQGAQDTHKVIDADEAKFFLERNKELMILEYLPGREYTIDCFSDRQKGLLFCSGRERVRIRNGISMNSKTINNDLWIKYAEIIAKQLRIHGAWFFQVKEDRLGNLKLMEIAPRIGGTMAVSRVRGINFPLLSIYEQERMKLRILTNDYGIEIDRALINRYKHNIKYKKIYIDFDDTIIINNKVNIEMLAFLYQERNKAKKIYLITKSKTDMTKKLKKYAITESLFDEIIHLKKGELKIDYINPRSAIFIDDSFSERESVANKYGIYTFDSHMVELLKDHKA